MRLQTNLVRRGTRYYYRGRVPEDLKHHYGKSEIIVSLKTSDRLEADYALSQMKATLFAEFARIRGTAISADHQYISTDSVPLQALKPLKTADERLNSVEHTLDHLIEYWASQTKKRPRTLMEVETAKQRLVGIAGHSIACQIGKNHAIELKDKLLAERLAVPTIQKQISLLSAVFEVAMVNDMVPANPFKDVKLVKPKVKQKSRVPFSVEDLRLIFNSPIFSDEVRPKGGAGEAAVWLPRIALLTGMRLEDNVWTFHSWFIPLLKHPLSLVARN